MEVLGGPDYICQGNETEQKLSNVMLFERILHVLNNAPFQQANRDIFLRERMVQMWQKICNFYNFLHSFILKLTGFRPVHLSLEFK